MTSSDLVDPAEYTRKVFDWAAAAGLRQVRLVIHQPKLGGPSEDVIPLDELEAFARELHLKADKVRVADAMFDKMPFEEWWPIYLNRDPSREACEYCRAMPICPSYQGKLQRDVGKDFAAIAEDGEIAPPTAVVDLNTAMKVVPMMEDWCKAVRAEVERKLLLGEDMPDFGLELGRQGNRKFINIEEAEAYCKKIGLTQREMYSFKLKTPPQLEHLTKPEKGEDGKKLPPVIGPTRWKRLTEMVTRDDAVPSVKPKSAIKVPYKPKPVDTSEFTPVVEDDLT